MKKVIKDKYCRECGVKCKIIEKVYNHYNTRTGEKVRAKRYRCPNYRAFFRSDHTDELI